MLNVLCVLKSGGIYTAEWVRKLRDGAIRNISKHRFICISDVDVPCERINLSVDWPSWWSKIFMFKEGIITEPTLYLDLDTVITGPVDCIPLLQRGPDFAMLQNFWVHGMVGSGVMWFSGDNVPHKVYDKFVKQPKAYMAHHERNEDGPYLGDQAFVWDALNREIEFINDYLPGIKSYKLHCRHKLPKDARIVCFHGLPRLTEVKADWLEEHWA